MTVLSVLHYYINIRRFLYYILFVYLKSFKELFLFVFTFVLLSKAFAKLTRFILNRQIFSKFFFKKVFQAVRMTRLTLSRSLTLCKVRYSVQRTGVTPTLALCFSMSLFLTSFPLESGCKSTHFFRFCKYHAHFFLNFFTLWLKYLVKQGVTEHIFFNFKSTSKMKYTLLYIKKEK